MIQFLSFVGLASAVVLQQPLDYVGWVDSPNDLSDLHTFRIMFSLKKNMTNAVALLDEISSPSSPRFRQWLSREAEAQLTLIASDRPVRSFLASAGVPHERVGDMVTANMSASQVRSIFATTTRTLLNANTNMTWVVAGKLTVPTEVATAVAYVYGVHGLPLPPNSRRGRQVRRAATGQAETHHRHGDTQHHARGAAASAVDVNVSPLLLRRHYGVPDGMRGNKSVQLRQAVVEFQRQYVNDDDISKFFAEFVPYSEPFDDRLYAYVGDGGTGFGTEALLDVEYLMGIAPGVLTEYWAWQDLLEFCSDVKRWTAAVIAHPSPPSVFSVSYGFQESVERVCGGWKDIDDAFVRIALRGISLIVASGDSGSGDTFLSGGLWPSWPSTSPYVTAVGATAFADDSMRSEVAATVFGSGSGFSDVDKVPSWQTAYASKYVDASGKLGTLPPSKMWLHYNGTYGRGTCDVSAIGEGFQTVVLGITSDVYGTSASTPTFAAMISLINHARAAVSKPPLGYLNPWLYSLSSIAFNDVTVGDDKHDKMGDRLSYGFDAMAGWDPPTGLGTPKFMELLKAAMSD